MNARFPARAATWLALAGLLLLAAGAARASTRYDHRLRFRTISTPRFDIHFHQGEEALAARLAAIAEEAASTLERTLGAASGRVQVILVDQNDLSNGWATPVPYNTIEITAAAPPGDSIIGNTDDWLRLVFTHEYTHIVHLSRSRGWIGGLQRVFGRLPVLYPNLFQPMWQIEGIATWQESAVTGQGRLPAGDFRQIIERGASSRRFEPLDRASSLLVDWPSGTTPYLYGGYFHRFLAERYGDAKLRDLTDETARRLPYFAPLAFRRVFGRSLGQLWDEYREAIGTGGGGPEAPGQAVRLTHHGFSVGAPRTAPDGRIFYSVANPHGFPALMVVAPGEAPRRVVDRYLGNRTSVAGTRLVFDQLDLVRQVGLQSDLYTFDLARRTVTRLTRDARAADPDVSPDGLSIVCTVQRADRRDVAVVPVQSALGGPAVPVALVSEAEVHFAGPRWSPDGRTIVAERRRTGGPSELVLIDAASRSVRTLISSDAARSVTPAWDRGGERVLFAAAVEGAPFRIYSVDVATGRVSRLEGTGSAEAPVLSADGRAVVYVGYTPDGYDVFSLTLADAQWTPVDWASSRRPAASVPDRTERPGSDALSQSRPYRPWRTLLPRFWTPTLESDAGEVVIGAATGSLDALGRHAYGVEAGWSTRGRPDWQAGYAYDRWWPTLFVAASDDTDPFRSGEARSREIEAGMLLPFRRVRWTQTAFLSWHASRDSIDCLDCAPPIAAEAQFRSVRAAWQFVSAKSFGYSISAEQGTAVRATGEWTREALGADADGGAWTMDVRRYQRLGPRHAVLAVRGAAARAWGDDTVLRAFSAAGSGPQPVGLDFGTDAIGLLRGFDEADVRGTRSVVLNADYRFPLFRLDRGAGTVPLFVRTFHAAAFVDAGHAWSQAFRREDIRVALGGEISVDLVLGYVLPVTVSGGVAWRRSPADHDRGAVAFARIGRAF